MERYICVHGHFYQPPRENPWLEAIELQDSAYPYHDWNERVADECYAPNAAARILDSQGRIVRILNNYARISYNFGPTLLAWMEDHAPETYRAVLEADRESRNRFGDHGSALAQAYNHMILPLAVARDRRTQVIWGIRDFEHRFGRRPEGLWLPETAVDLETLELLAELGIRFTILAPHQARRVRPAGSQQWRDVTGAKIDPTMPYRQDLPSGRSLAVFFYDGPISRAVAFEGLLRNGDRFAQRLADAFLGERERPQLVHIATDGETYGHHHRYGEMALAYALQHIADNERVRLTNYGEYLAKHPPTHEVEVLEDTSWSCVHGLERWKGDCGCRTGGERGWNQAWRAPLRAALDWLRDTLAPQYETRASALLKDPWAARDDYIDVILTRSPESISRFLDTHATRAVSNEERVTVLKLLELQRHALLMYTSCGWFFNELSGIETVQVIQYAGRAVQLAQELFGNDTETHFLERLVRAKSNVPDHRDGRHIYEKLVKPAIVDLPKVGAHYAVSSLFEPYAERARVYCYTVDRSHYESREAGRARLALGRARVTSGITGESAALSFGGLHFGDHNVTGGVRADEDDAALDALATVTLDAFARADFPAVLRLLDGHFPQPSYTLKSLFRDEQRKILDWLLESTLSDAEAVYRRLYEHNASLMRFVLDLGIPLPNAFQMTAEFVLNTSLIRVFSEEELDLDRARALLAEAKAGDVALDADGLGYALEGTLESLTERLSETPTDLALLRQVEAVSELVHTLPFDVSLWRVQNIYYEMLRSAYTGFQKRAAGGETGAREWVEHFRSLGEKLSVAVG